MCCNDIFFILNKSFKEVVEEEKKRQKMPQKHML